MGSRCLFASAARLPSRPLSLEAMSAKSRQARARSFAMKNLGDGNIKEISNSMLVALLPALMAKNYNGLIETVCDELKSRFP